jgi:membrane peptidoglycan carboxypeptidase
MFSQDLLTPAGDSGWRGPSGLRRPFYQRWWFKLFFVLLVLGALAGMVAWNFYVLPLKERAETFDLEQIKKLEVATVIYDRTGAEMSRLYETNRQRIKLKEVPKFFQEALLAQEDSRFYDHHGVDWYGVARATYQTALRAFTGQGVQQGASTLTQQLGRGTFNLMEKELSRKILEWFLAMRIERVMSKQDIMEHYLNRIFFGSGNGQNFYGVQAAAQGYYGKNVAELTLEESATLVGLIKAPNNYSPLRRPEAAKKARNIVLDRMVEERYLDANTAAANKAKPIVTLAASVDPRFNYAFDAIKEQAMQIVGEERAAVGGFNIYTTIDPALQRQSEDAVKKRLAEVETMKDYPHQTHAQYRRITEDFRAKLKSGAISKTEPKPDPQYLQGAALVVDNATGGILAMVGGRDYLDSYLNRVTGSARPPGTAFTPFVFAHAFSSASFYPGTLLEDAPLDNRLVMVGGSMVGTVGEWGAESMDASYSMTKISARESLSLSKNAQTVRLAYKAFPMEKADQPSIKPLMEMASKAGIQSPIKEAPASFLGVSELKLSELCLAYTSFPNAGERPAALTLITKITDPAGTVVYQADSAAAKVRVMDEIAAYQTHTCLVDALDRGTGKAGRAEFGLKKFPAAGKTGSHDGYKDLWFMGYSPRVTCGVWVGFDKANVPIAAPPNAFSSRIALPIWSDIMNLTQDKYAGGEFRPPNAVERIEICNKSGMRATDFCYEMVKAKTATGAEIDRSVRCSYLEYVRPGTTISSTCSLHTGTKDGGSDIVTLDDFKPSMSIGVTAAEAATGRFATVDPVHMQAPTIQGEDPFESIIPVPKARPVSADGTEVRRPEIIEDELPKTQVPVQLQAPKPVRIE